MGLFEVVIGALCLNATFCPSNITEDESYIQALLVQTRKEFLRKMEEQLQNEDLTITTLMNENLSGATREEDDSPWVGTGVAFALLNILQKKYKFNYTIVVPEENIYGPLNEKNGVLNMLKNNEADLSVAFHPFIPEYTRDVNYSPSLDTSEWVVLMKRPRESATGSGLLAPFTLPVWILILISLVVVGPIIYFIIYVQAKLCKNEEDRLFPLPACIWFVYGALLKQGTTLSPTTDSSRLLFATWWIFITILTAFYTANLTAFLTLSKFTLPINTPEDIGAKKSKWVTTRGNALEDTITEMTSTIGEPQGFIDDVDKEILNNQVKIKNHMFIREKPIVEYVMYDDYKEKARAGIDEEHRCTYVITKFSVKIFQRAFAYAKNFKYKPLFDETIRHLVESGIIKYKLREDLPDTEICPLDLGSKERRLRNADLIMTYEIVGGGFIISLVIFLAEILFVRPKFRFRRKHLPGNKDGRLFQLVSDHYDKFGAFQAPPYFVTPPPSYHTLFTQANELKGQNIKKRNINGRDYWVYDSHGKEPRMIPLRTPSALLFQYTN